MKGLCISREIKREVLLSATFLGFTGFRALGFATQQQLHSLTSKSYNI